MSLTSFNNIKAAEIQPLIDNLWKDPATFKSYSPKANTLKAILENQTAVLQTLEDPEKKRDLAVKWVDFCGDTSADGIETDDCNNSVGGEGTAQTKSYALDIFVTDKFSVAQEELESAVVSFDEIVATGLASKLKNLVENFNKKSLAVIAANKGVNPYAGDYSYDAVSKDTSIGKSHFGGETIIPYIMQVVEQNKSQQVYLLDGGNLFQDYYKASKYAANMDGKAAQSMYDDLAFRHDLTGFAANGLSAYTFLVDKGSLAIANRSKYPTLQQLAGAKDGGWTHTAQGSFMRYSIPINMPDLLPMMFISQGKLIKQQLMVDVQYSVVCDNNALKPTWALKLRGGVFANPIRCNTGNTGILSFLKVND